MFDGGINDIQNKTGLFNITIDGIVIFEFYHQNDKFFVVATNKEGNTTSPIDFDNMNLEIDKWQNFHVV